MKLQYQIALESGEQFTAAGDRSVVDSAISQGQPFPYSCRNGQCGACHARVLAGRTEYLNDYQPPGGLPRDQVVCCQAMPVSDLTLQPLEQPQPWAEPQQLSVTVDHKQLLAENVMGLWLRLPETELLDYRPGQYIELILRGGEKRSYSLANARAENNLLELHVRYQPGGLASEWIFGPAQAGDSLAIEGPMGRFHLRESSGRPVIMVAGGTGLAPIKALIEYGLVAGRMRSVHLYAGAADESSLYLPEAAGQWQQSGIGITPVLMDAEKGEGRRSGPVHQAVLEDYQDLSAFDLYMAGPPGMIQPARESFLAYRLPEERLFIDQFNPGVRKSLWERLTAGWRGKS